MKEETKEKLVGEGVGFERIRRITGYLVGTVDRFNNGKRAEERDRVKHGTEGLMSNKELIQNQGIALPVLSKSGFYYIDGMKFEYDNNEHRIIQTLYLIKRGNLTNMQNKHTSPKLDDTIFGDS